MISLKRLTSRNDSLKIIVLGVLILVAGIVIGATTTFIAFSPTTSLHRQQPELFAQQMLRQLDHELNLSDEQRRQLGPLIQTHYAALQQIRDEARPRIVDQLEQLDNDILSALNEDQTRRWQRNRQRLEEGFPSFGQRRRDGRGPHGPHEPLGAGRRRNRAADQPTDQPPNPPADLQGPH